MLKLILVVTLFVSCAWNFKRNNDLKTIDVTNLDIDKATQQKFVVKEVVQTEEVIEAPKVSAPVKKETKKNEAKKEIAKTDESKKEEIEEEITDEDIQKKNKVIEVYYPKDYPNKFIELDKKSEKVWKQFSPKVFTGESQDIEVSYLGITVGKIFLTTKKDVMVGDKQAYHFYAHLKSAPFYRFIYELDDTLESFVEKKTFLPVSYKLLQIETNKKIEDYQLLIVKITVFISVIKKIKKVLLPMKRWTSIFRNTLKMPSQCFILQEDFLLRLASPISFPLRQKIRFGT